MSATPNSPNTRLLNNNSFHSEPAALAVEAVSFFYGKKTALQDVSFNVHAGESVILLGPNGAGKTTLFSLICGLYAADQGQISIQGKTLLSGAEALRPLGIVFQSQTLDLDLSVEQNLRYFCALQGIPRKLAQSRIDNGLAKMDLNHQRNHKIRTLNGGHRRRVEIIRATLHSPRILLLDEPTVGLDIPTRTELVNYLHSLPQEEQCAVLWATHLADEIHPSDRVILLHQGKIFYNQDATSLLSDTGVSSYAELLQSVMES